MKHLREDYDGIQDLSQILTIWPAPGTSIEADEPVFVLRAKDPSAPSAVLAWAQDVLERGGDPDLCERVAAWSLEMEEWRRTNHPDKIVADVPKEMLR